MNRLPSSPWRVALCGLAMLALIMGIGRFAFTPILPMMQSDWGVSIAQGGWLAAANYLGYFAGGLAAMRFRFRPVLAMRLGLLAVTLCTGAMAFDQRFPAWLALRALAGFASAWVMVYGSAWVLDRLAAADRAELSGVVYAGVGAGIVLAGIACVAIFAAGENSSSAWIALAVAAAGLTAFVWQGLGDEAMAAGAPARARDALRIPEFRRLVLCYGALGFGYIIPATFLPLMAKQVLSDPSWFAWAWPIFGLAAALSSLAAGKLERYPGNRATWIAANSIMAAGVLIPLVLTDIGGIALAALLVGGTFMVVTMAGLKAAREAAGADAHVLMGAMTASFGLGQILGPVLVSMLAHLPNGFAYALVASAAALLAAACSLAASRVFRLESAAATTK